MKPGPSKRGLSMLAGIATMMAIAGPVSAAETGTVGATVIPASTCVALGTNTTIAYGTKSFSTVGQNSTGSTIGQSNQSIANCSATAESLLAHGTSAVGDGQTPATWQLSGPTAGTPGSIAANFCSTVGADIYGHGVTVMAPGNVVLSQAFLGTTDTGLINPLTFTPNSSFDYFLTLLMPCSGSNGTGQTMSMSIVFVATQ